MSIYDSTNIDIDSTCLISNIQAYMDALKNVAKTNVYDSSNTPKILQTVNYNPDWNNSTEYAAVTNPVALISNDLDSLTTLDSIKAPQNKEEVMNASTILNAFRSMISNISKIHNFSTQWSHQSSSGDYLVGTMSGKAFFKEELSDGISGNTSTNTPSIQYTRTVPQTFYTDITTAYDSMLEKDKEINADNIKNLMQALYDNWTANIDNKFTYEIWSCHYNCHYNCHSSGRGRR